MAFFLSPSGRITGPQFFGYLAALLIAMLLIGFALGTIPAIDGPLIMSGLWLIAAWPTACLCAKRLHDTGKSARWLWCLAPQVIVTALSFVAGLLLSPLLIGLMVVGIFANVLCWGLVLYLAFARGQAYPNRFGPEPV